MDGFAAQPAGAMLRCMDRGECLAVPLVGTAIGCQGR
jgi:hypothetical protein